MTRVTRTAPLGRRYPCGQRPRVSRGPARSKQHVRHDPSERVCVKPAPAPCPRAPGRTRARETVCVEVVLAPLSYSDEGDAPARQVRQGRERAVGSVPPLTASRHRGPRVWRPSTPVRAADVCPTEHGGHRGGGGPRRGVRTHEQKRHPRPRPSPDPQRWDSGREGP